ncbi:hypothetical protein N7488_000919 [Penicillium malachiteum]|nr:hypothetical protein N7488_000919 [Penicillium malachiteum]
MASSPKLPGRKMSSNEYLVSTMGPVTSKYQDRYRVRLIFIVGLFSSLASVINLVFNLVFKRTISLM